MWMVAIAGADADISALREVAAFNDITIDKFDGQPCLAAASFEPFGTAERLRPHAVETLALLNGGARVLYPDHNPVSMGSSIYQVHPDGRKDVAVFPLGVSARVRVSLSVVVVNADGSLPGAPPDPRANLFNVLLAKPETREILRVLSGELTWHRLRLAFEKFVAIAGGSDNALARDGYATQAEISALKANIEDPRLSGLDAVHGVPTGPKPRGQKMTLIEGQQFINRLLREYAARQPPATSPPP